MSEAVTLDYEQLVAAYWQSLTTVLRGFQAAPGFEFLETWVPDDDHTMSVLGIIGAANDAGLMGLRITVGSEVLRTLDLPGLTERAGQVGHLRIERWKAGGAELQMSFQGSQA